MCADVKPRAERSEPVASEAAAAESSSLLSAPDNTAVLKRHKPREHKRVYRCSLCNKVFQNSSNLNRHIRSHGVCRREKLGLACGWLCSYIIFKISFTYPSRGQAVQV